MLWFSQAAYRLGTHGIHFIGIRDTLSGSTGISICRQSN